MRSSWSNLEILPVSCPSATADCDEANARRLHLCSSGRQAVCEIAKYQISKPSPLKCKATYQRCLEQLARHWPPLLQLPCCISEHSSSHLQCLQHGQQRSVEKASVARIGPLEEWLNMIASLPKSSNSVCHATIGACPKVGLWLFCLPYSKFQTLVRLNPFHIRTSKKRKK